MTPTQFFSQTQLNLLHTNSENPADPIPVVKIFTPFHNCTWLLTELDPENNDTAFGICDLGFETPELGFVSVHEILSRKIPVE